MPADFLTQVLLVAASFITSVFGAVVGMGAGAMILALMATLMPPSVLIPVHGMIMCGHNFFRAWFVREFVNWHVALPFLFGSVLGIAVGSQVLIALPEDVLKLALGTSLIILTWAPALRAGFKLPHKWVFIGSATGFLSLFIGATGGLLGALMSRGFFRKNSTVATHAACMASQHGLKTLAFMFMGFSFWPYLPLVAAMLAAGYLGSWAGKYVLDYIPEEQFRILFKAMITLLALRLIIQAVG